jgi:MFS family permease
VDEGPAGARVPAAVSGRVLLALVLGQIGVHAPMAGLRMAAPLQALRDGAGAWAVGLLMALYALAPVMLAMQAGRMADRHGYHRPVRVAVGLTAAGAVLAVISTWLPGWPHFVLLAASAMCAGAGANIGMIAIQRTAALTARDSTQRVRIFSWLGVAPSISNVIGPVSAGFMIDLGGFGPAYLLMLVLPALTLWASRQVPLRDPLDTPAQPAKRRSPWTLLHAPGMKRLLIVNWLLAACWDVHAFAVPILGHEYGFSASTIGLILGTFTLAVTMIRLVIPGLAHRLREATVVQAAMLGSGAVFALYPWADTPWSMGGLAVLLGMTLGVAQPMIMSTLHRLTPDQRHGEALAFRSMAINFSSAVMPLLFGVIGVAAGAAVLFWAVGGAVSAGAWVARGLAPSAPTGPRT